MNLAGLLLLLFIVIPVSLFVLRMAMLVTVIVLSLVFPPFRRHFAAKQVAAQSRA